MNKIVSLLLVIGAFICFSFVESNFNSSISTSAQAVEYRQVQALHILVPTEQQAENIREEIMTGKDQKEVFSNFMNSAKKYSKCPSGSSGGILGWFGKGDMVPEFEQAAFSLPNGQVSMPVKTNFGWHLIYVISKK